MLRSKWGIALGALLVATVLAWYYRGELGGYYHAWRWSVAPADVAAYHAHQLAQLGESAWPALHWLLHRAAPGPSQELHQLITQWWRGLLQSGRMPAMLKQLARDWDGLDELEQAHLLEALATLIANSPTAASANSTSDAISSTPDQASPNDTETLQSVRNFLLHTQPLSHVSGRLAIVRLTHWACVTDQVPSSASAGLAAAEHPLANGSTEQEAWLSWCRALAELALNDDREAIRLEAVRLGSLPQLAMLEKLAQRLAKPPGEPSAAVRTLLLVAIGDSQLVDIAPSEELARWLHDESPEVRATCEQVLRARGLTPRQIQLARMWTDNNPLVRAQVPKLLYEADDLDSVAWLERLSRDPEPVVRAAVIRVAAEHLEVRFAARLAELAQQDHNPTVRELAHYYQRELWRR